VAERPDNEALLTLLSRALDDDRDAWREIVETHSGVMLAVAGRTFAAYGFRPVAQDAEDVVAAAWSSVLANDRRIVRQCLRNGQWLPMLYALVRNRAVDVMRAHKIATVPLDGVDVPEPAPGEPTEAFSSDLPALREAMDGLSPREQLLVRLFFLQGRRYREIADLTGIAQNSIGPTLGRALKKMRGALVRKRKEPR
jgi:RNA polymerase sigma-70 factor (ECF subfamily)